MIVATEEQPDEDVIGIRCPRCHCRDARIMRTTNRRLIINRKTVGRVVRRRRCRACKFAFTTMEYPIDDD